VRHPMMSAQSGHHVHYWRATLLEHHKKCTKQAGDRVAISVTGNLRVDAFANTDRSSDCFLIDVVIVIAPFKLVWP